MVSQGFGTLDYVVLVAVLCVSMGIGIFFAIQGARTARQGSGEYLMGNRNMSTIPIAISIMASFLSAILMIGMPAELYTGGSINYTSAAGISLGLIIATFLYIPIMYPLKMTSVYEYLELRFTSRAARLLGTTVTILVQIVYMGIALYAPCLALNTVTDIPTWVSTIAVGLVATCYTSIGGMRAVVWTDVFQASIMLCGLLIIIARGVYEVGSIGRVWEITGEWKRNNFFELDPDPRVRHTTWGLTFGACFLWQATFGFSQAAVQRYNSLPSLRRAIYAMLFNLVGVNTMVILACFAGTVIFAYYADQDCNPLSFLGNPNSVAPYYVLDTLSYPGVAGLFISSLFAGSLSSVSSMLNANSAILWVDFIQPTYGKRMSDRAQTALLKIMVAIFGMLAIFMGLAAANMTGTVVSATMGLAGAATGPMLGMFVQGAFFPVCNKYGALVGTSLSLPISVWLAIGNQITDTVFPDLPYPEGTCFPLLNATSALTNTTLAPPTAVFNTTLPPLVAHAGDRNGLELEDIYHISYIWHSLIGMINCLLIGVVVSILTRNCIPEKERRVSRKYLQPFVLKLYSYLPDCCGNYIAPYSYDVVLQRM